MDFGAVVDALAAQGYGNDKLEQLGEKLGFADSVTVEQLAAAGVPHRTVFDLRRRLDPAVVAAEVCQGDVMLMAGVMVVRRCVCVCEFP